MKNFLFCLLAVCMLVVSGCSKSDDTPKNYAEVIYGKWYQTAYKNSSTNSFIGQEDGTYLQFNQNGTFEYFYSGWGAINETTKGTYTMNTDFAVNLVLSDGTTSSIAINEIEGNNAVFHSLLIPSGTFKYERR